MALPYPINRVADASVVVMMLAVSVVFGAYTFLDILCIQRAPRLAFNFDYWQGQQFARLWKAFGGLAGKKVKPIVSSLASVASKVVLDIGPGSGHNIEFYKKENISKLYLVEPCQYLHEDLRANLKKAGLEDVSTIIACGVQDRDVFREHGITPASVDTVVTFSVLCSVPAPTETCKFLYSLLKPGGQWVLVEHVLADQKYPFSRRLQDTFQLLWSIVAGGCSINRDTEKYVKEAGPWSQVELAKGEGEFGWEVMGRAVGRLVK